MKKLWILPVLLLAGSFLFFGCGPAGPSGPPGGATEVLFENGQWAAELGTVTALSEGDNNDPANNTVGIVDDLELVNNVYSVGIGDFAAFYFENTIDISEYEGIEVELVDTQGVAYWSGGQLFFYDDTGWEDTDPESEDFGETGYYAKFGFWDGTLGGASVKQTFKFNDTKIAQDFPDEDDYPLSMDAYLDTFAGFRIKGAGTGPLSIKKISLIGGSGTPDPEGDVRAFELGADFDYEGGSPLAQKGWNSEGVEDTGGNPEPSTFEWEHMQEAKYLVIESKGSNNNDGFGGLQAVLQGDGNSWAWSSAETTVIENWISFAHTPSETVYLVIQLDKLNTYDEYIAGTKGRLVISYYSNLVNDLGFQNAYLVLDDFAKPSPSTDIPGGFGYITKGIDMAEWIILNAAFYTVSFDANGGTGTIADMEDVQGGTKINLPDGTDLTAPANTVFGGWKEGETGTVIFAADAEYTVKGDVTFYAVWKNLFKVSFDANGGTGTMADIENIVDGETIRLPANTFTAPVGSIFSGNWAADSEMGGQFAVDYEYEVTADVIFYALWVSEGTTYTVSFDANGGEGTIADMEDIEPNDSITLPANSFTAPDGKEFDYWAEGSESGTKYEADDDYTVTGNVTFYAVWKDAYTPNPLVANKDYTLKLEGLNLKNAEPTTKVDDNIFFDISKAFPSGFDINDYAYFTVKAKFFYEDGEDYAEADNGWGRGSLNFTTVATGWPGTWLLDSNLNNLNTSETTFVTIPGSFDTTPARIYVQNSKADIGYIEVTEITFHTVVTPRLKIYDESTGWDDVLGAVTSGNSGGNNTHEFEIDVTTAGYQRVIIVMKDETWYQGGSVEGAAADGATWINAEYWGGFVLKEGGTNCFASFNPQMVTFKKLVLGNEDTIDDVEAIYLE